jgi:hypothetical protein
VTHGRLDTAPPTQACSNNTSDLFTAIFDSLTTLFKTWVLTDTSRQTTFCCPYLLFSLVDSQTKIGFPLIKAFKNLFVWLQAAMTAQIPVFFWRLLLWNLPFGFFHLAEAVGFLPASRELLGVHSLHARSLDDFASLLKPQYVVQLPYLPGQSHQLQL